MLPMAGFRVPGAAPRVIENLFETAAVQRPRDCPSPPSRGTEDTFNE